MIYISHRGNLDGPNKERENSPSYVIEALDKGFDVEVDVWFVDGEFWLGHDEPQYKTDYKFLVNEKLWCHAKNLGAILEMKKYVIHYFWHENDKISLTSKNYIWTYPGNQPISGSIAVLPEIYNDDVSKCKGICSDFIGNYSKF
jgi:hypothetical protein